MNTSPIAADALSYINHGWSVVPVPYRSKKCLTKGWSTLRLTANDVPTYFNGSRSNIGVLPGEPSGWRVDVDMDVEEAVVAGCRLLPATNLIHGRVSNPESHRWYHVSGPVKSQEWEFTEAGSDKPTMIIELRANGRQTLVPPSLHPEGEQYRWEREGMPGEVTPDDLTRRVGQVAAAALIARHWPGKGTRDKAAMALAGLLLRASWSDEDIDSFVSLVSICARDEEHSSREKATAASSSMASR